MSILLGAALAGLTYFVWSAISWMALPWQRGAFARFDDEDRVAETIAAHAPASGIYGIPSEPAYPDGASKQERERIDAAAWERLQRGPIVLAVVRHERIGTLPRMLSVALVGDLAVALLLAGMLAQTAGLSYGGRVAFVAAAAVAAGLACRVPDWNWHQFPARYTIVNAATLAVGWTLAAVVLAHFVRGRP
jgi:hypothetical protein